MRLIDGDALIKAIVRKEPFNDCARVVIAECMEEVRHAPTVEPQRKTGKWQITDAYPHNVYCSVCHKKFAQTHWAVWEDGSLPRNYCPNCGAKMEEGDTDDRT